MTKKRKSAAEDANQAVSRVLGATVAIIPGKGEDLISDPKLKRAFREIKKRAQKKP